jgi:UDP-2,3-diacylglucosamine pyrophosphatase LpxH
MRDDFNYLILSDLHLQEAERDPAGRLFYFDQEFADLLRHYRLFSVDGRRWRLIIGGDFLEFFVIKEQPETDDRLLRGTTLRASDRRFFPGTEWQKSVWKLDLILRSHPQLLLALARFIGSGHEIYVLRGNHDLELFWPQVQDHFRTLIAEHHPSDLGYLDVKRAARSQIHFPPWFYYEPGLLYVEHGHQYDEYCANAHNLYPVLAGRPGQLQLAISAFTMRYFASRVQKADPAAMENMATIPRYLRHLLLSEPSLTFRLPGYYVEGVTRTLAKAGRLDARAEAFVAGAESVVREEIARGYGLEVATLEKLEALGQPPLLLDRVRAAQGLGIDLVLGTIGSVVAAAAHRRRGRRWIGLGALASLPLWGLAWRRRITRATDHRNLRDIARRVRDLLGVQYVVFGHSHDPDVDWLDAQQDAVYFNVGTWLPKGGRSQMVYLHVVRGRERASAQLMRWDRVHKRPVEVDPADYVLERRAQLHRRQAAERASSASAAPPGPAPARAPSPPAPASTPGAGAAGDAD